jgi:hypothetical protein
MPGAGAFGKSMVDFVKQPFRAYLLAPEPPYEKVAHTASG